MLQHLFLRLVFVVSLATGLAIAGGAAAQVRSSCPAVENPATATASTNRFPTASWPESEQARFVLPYALMARDVRGVDDDNLGPYGFRRSLDSNQLFAADDRGALARAGVTGFYGATFFDCTERSLVIVIRSTSPYDPRDLILGIFRQMSGGESELALRFFDAVAARFPGYRITVTGHSSAGGPASYLGAQRGVRSVVFNGTRSDAAVTNSGAIQFLTIVNGDPISDPLEASRRHGGVVVPALSGATLRIEPPMDYSGWKRHWISTVIDGLTGQFQ